ncbi:hypothetical protein BDN70DRAFT_90235 [Pholiota conissans]|uniref:Uncharacterized protein n=1 Tax=Pholiota conissans TaxID=109636 RepID=A0A9P5YXW6_9AGAR|nr:hypothetical protein BDN70DRAFT_90235 [Pholiota conissans]
MVVYRFGTNTTSRRLSGFPLRACQHLGACNLGRLLDIWYLSLVSLGLVSLGLASWDSISRLYNHPVNLETSLLASSCVPPPPSLEFFLRP